MSKVDGHNHTQLLLELAQTTKAIQMNLAAAAPAPDHRTLRWTGTTNLGSIGLAGRPGIIRAISRTGSGVTRISFVGANPNSSANASLVLANRMFVNPEHYMADLGQFRLRNNNLSGHATVFYEVL